MKSTLKIVLILICAFLQTTFASLQFQEAEIPENHESQECRIRKVVDCESGVSPLLSNMAINRGIPGKRGQKGERGYAGEQGIAGNTGVKGDRGEPGKSFNESRIHHVEKENKKLKKEVHHLVNVNEELLQKQEILENFTQELLQKYEHLENLTHELLKKHDKLENENTISEIGIKGDKGELGKSFNESIIHHVENENKKLKKEIHHLVNVNEELLQKQEKLENFTQEFLEKHEKMENENTNLKNLVYKFMGGKPCLVDFTAPTNGNMNESVGSILPHGSDVIITCHYGYIISGQDKRSCNNGKFPSLEERPIECIFKAPDCSAINDSSRKNGVYSVTPFDDQTINKEVYCDLETDEYGWIVIMRRFDGSVSFGRTWEEYSSGFGDINNEHWMGLRDLYEILKSRNYVLRIDMEDFNGGQWYAQYETFYIGSEDEKFPIYFGGYSGTAGDSFSGENGRNMSQGQKFSTIDDDNDGFSSSNCATSQGGNGGWWYATCSFNSLTGQYGTGGLSGLTWWSVTKSGVLLKKVQMKIKRRN